MKQEPQKPDALAGYTNIDCVDCLQSPFSLAVSRVILNPEQRVHKKWRLNEKRISCPAGCYFDRETKEKRTAFSKQSNTNKENKVTRKSRNTLGARGFLAVVSTRNHARKPLAPRVGPQRIGYVLLTAGGMN